MSLLIDVLVAEVSANHVGVEDEFDEVCDHLLVDFRAFVWVHEAPDAVQELILFERSLQLLLELQLLGKGFKG